MNETYRYLYTRISIFGSLPTHKVFVSNTNNKSKLVFADNTFIYGLVFDSRASAWSKEPKSFLENEKIRLNLYKASHPTFITEAGTG